MASGDGEYIIPLGQYRLQFEELGKGSFGIVYKGINTKDGSEVAAKKIKYKEQGEEINEFISKMGNNELEIFRKLQGHENIVKLLDYQNDGKSHWFIMEFCELGDLPKYLKRKPVNFDTKVKIIAECASAITFMHSFKPPIVHCNIKPSNVLMKREGIQDAAKITDFGIGKIYNDPNLGPQNVTMTTAGDTQSFMAPEFFEADGGDLRYQPGIDTFSLGLLFHVILMHNDHHRDMTPISVNSRQLGQNIHYGFEVFNAKKLNQPIQPLLYIDESDLPSVKILKELITHMTAYSVHDRKSLSDVKGSVMELYCKHLQKRTTDVSHLANDLKSTKINISATYAEPVKAVCLKKPLVDQIIISINHLSLKPDAEILHNDDISKLFVEYRFLNVAPEETECPYALPKPAPGKEISFNFTKTFQVDYDKHYERRQYLASMLSPDDPEHGKIKFTVVSDPSDELEDGECEDVGKVYVSIRDIMDSNKDLDEVCMDILDANDESQVIGQLNLTVRCLDALKAVQKEMTLVPS